MKIHSPYSFLVILAPWRETSFRKGYDLAQRTQEMRVTGLELGLRRNFGSELMKNSIIPLVNGLDE
jgi:hypothetical protein